MNSNLKNGTLYIYVCIVNRNKLYYRNVKCKKKNIQLRDRYYVDLILSSDGTADDHL